MIICSIIHNTLKKKKASIKKNKIKHVFLIIKSV
jgi:hypothetical protein